MVKNWVHDFLGYLDFHLADLRHDLSVLMHLILFQSDPSLFFQQIKSPLQPWLQVPFSQLIESAEVSEWEEACVGFGLDVAE